MQSLSDSLHIVARDGGGDVLFLAQRLPFPPNKGDKIRSYNFLKHIASKRRVHLGCFIDDPRDWEEANALKKLCGETCFIGLEPGRARVRSLKGFFSGQALTIPYYHDRKMAAWVRSVIDTVKPRTAFVFSSAMAQYVTARRQDFTRIIMDFVDVDSEKWRLYADNQPWPLSWVYKRENRALLAYDRWVAGVVDASVFVSKAESDLFRALAPECADKISFIENGIYSDFFSPERTYISPFNGGPVLVFTGAMDYWPNINAVKWFVKKVLPLVRSRIPKVEFFIVGGNPTTEVQGLQRQPGVSVTGRVDDVRPYIAHSDVVVVPLRIARGVQNKLLEGMAMGKAVVATPQAVEGIDAHPGTELLMGETAETFAGAVIEAMDERVSKRLGAAARSRMTRDFDWGAKMAVLDNLLNI